MHGFQPANARGKAQKFAEGGMVRGLMRRVMGIPEPVAAPAPAPAAAPAPAPAPAPEAAPQRALTQYAGMSSTERRMKEAGLRDGGPVRGPGTGTSDSIDAEVRPGSYIMPADTTDKIGEQGVAALGFSPVKVPVKLSNGEYELPPEQVHAVGVQALDAIKDATHTPTNGARGLAPAGEEPPIFFADGGVVDEDRKRLNSFGDAAGRGAVFGMYPRPSNARSTNANDAALQRGVQATGPSTFQPAEPMKAPPAPARLNNLTDPRSSQFAGSVAERAPVGFTAGAAAPAATTSTSVPTELAGQKEPPGGAAAQVMPGVFRRGNSYADSAAGAVRGFEPGGGISAQNLAAADALEARGIAERVGERAVGSASALGFAPGAGMAVIGDGDAARREARNASVGSTVLGLPGQGDAAVGAVRSLRAERENRADGREVLRGTLQAQQAAASNAAAMEREQLQQAGASGRTAVTEAGANARAAASNAVQRGELALRQEAQGFHSRAARDQEALRRTMVDPNATPEQRQQAQQALLVSQGKSAAERFTVVPGGQEVDPTTQQLATRPARVFNNQTGQFVDQPPATGAGAKAPPAQAVADLRKNPALAAQFDAKYGAGAARSALGR